VTWSKSGHTNSNPIPIRVLLGPYDKQFKDVGVSYGIGDRDGSVRSRTEVPSASYYPEFNLGKVKIGEPQVLGYVKGDHEIVLGCLLIPRSLVNSRRNGLWAVRKDLMGTFPSIWQCILTRGRTGQFAAD
jgi:hypothetical protein